MTSYRKALEREGDRFDLAPGALDRLFERRRRKDRNRRIRAGIFVFTLLVVGAWGAVSVLGGVASHPRPASSPTTNPSASSTLAPFPIPDGIFHATATRKDALAKGFSKTEIDKAYGADGKLPLTLILDQGTYQQFGVYDGVEQLGDMGTYTATKKLLVMTSLSQGCHGCVYTIRWTFHGQVLSLKILSSSAGPADLRGARLVAEHEYVKTS